MHESTNLLNDEQSFVYIPSERSSEVLRIATRDV
jgi:hypothetical protein